MEAHSNKSLVHSPYSTLCNECFQSFVTALLQKYQTGIGAGMANSVNSDLTVTVGLVPGIMESLGMSELERQSLRCSHTTSDDFIRKYIDVLRGMGWKQGKMKADVSVSWERCDLLN